MTPTLTQDPYAVVVTIQSDCVVADFNNGSYIFGAHIRRGSRQSRIMRALHKNLGAFVLGRAVHVPPGVADSEVPWAHECAHVWQLYVTYRGRKLRFWYAIAREWARHGHAGSCFEQQADRIARIAQCRWTS